MLTHAIFSSLVSCEEPLAELLPLRELDDMELEISIFGQFSFMVRLKLLLSDMKVSAIEIPAAAGSVPILGVLGGMVVVPGGASVRRVAVPCLPKWLLLLRHAVRGDAAPLAHRHCQYHIKLVTCGNLLSLI